MGFVCLRCSSLESRCVARLTQVKSRGAGRMRRLLGSFSGVRMMHARDFQLVQAPQRHQTRRAVMQQVLHLPRAAQTELRLC